MQNQFSPSRQESQTHFDVLYRYFPLTPRSQNNPQIVVSPQSPPANDSPIRAVDCRHNRQGFCRWRSDTKHLAARKVANMTISKKSLRIAIV